MYNHNKAQQSKNRVHISWDILYMADDEKLLCIYVVSLTNQLKQSSVAGDFRLLDAHVMSCNKNYSVYVSWRYEVMGAGRHTRAQMIRKKRLLAVNCQVW